LNDGKQINKLFDESEGYTIDKLNQRRNINDKLVHDSVDFQTFWAEHCESTLLWCIYVFYIGTFLLLFASAAFIYAQFSIGYVSTLGAVSGLFGMFISLIGIFIVISMRAKVISFSTSDIISII
jgi:hypothetical protein